ncbi:hypothetical protein [Pollutibacter soli]|uniref:hypothetical protein n=1 Tax=Pollutibacter soli TaxID=3034157 RepID=UPI00301330CF
MSEQKKAKQSKPISFRLNEKFNAILEKKYQDSEISKYGNKSLFVRKVVMEALEK